MPRRVKTGLYGSNGSESRKGLSLRSRIARRRAITRCVVVFLFSCASLVSGHAAAYRTGADLPQLSGTPKVRWESATIEYEINESGAPGVPFSATQNAIFDAARTWASVSCGGPDFRSLGVTSNHASPADGHNTIEWVSDWSARGYLSDAAGQTDVQYEQDSTGNWQIVEADVYLNAESQTWTANASVDPASRDVATVLTHELGHVLGLMHPCELVAKDSAPKCTPAFGRPTMHPVYGADQISLEADDEAGACFLYPSSTCTADSCAAGETCTRDGCKASCGGTVCSVGQSCVDDACVTPATCPDGLCPESCQSTSDCSSGLGCVHGKCAPGASQRGDLCGHNEDCESGSCVDGFCAISCSDAHPCVAGESCEATTKPNVCVSPLHRMGETCQEAHDCIGDQCLAGGSGGPVCSRACGTDSACPVDWVCSSVNEREVCTPPWFKASGGCDVASTGREPARSWWGSAALALAIFRRRRVVSAVARNRGKRS